MQDKPGMNIGVVGLGGLGHMVVKWGKAFGCKVGRAAAVSDDLLAVWWGCHHSDAAFRQLPMRPP